MRRALTVSVTVEGGGLKTLAAASGLGRWLGNVAPASARGSVSIAIVTDRRLQRLNRRYRKKNAATDVLSFPSSEDTSRPASHDVVRDVLSASRRADRFWGDIAIAAGVASRQARSEGHALAVELRVLALHGLLHLLGYDHEVDKGRMHRVEDRLRRLGGLPSGLVGRAASRSSTTRSSRR